MTQEFKDMVNELKAAGMDDNTLAKVELVNEYMTNEGFADWLNAYVFQNTYKEAK